MVVRPRREGFRAQGISDGGGDLRSETQMVDRMREGVPRLALGRVEIIIQIMDMHGSIAEAATGGDVEIPHHLVDSKPAFNATPLVPLRVQLLTIVLSLALFDILPLPKRPAHARIGFPHFLAGGAAALFLCGGRGGRAVAVAAVVGREVGGFLVAVEVQRGDLDGETALGRGGELDFGETVFYPGLLLAGDVHYVEGEEFAGDAGEGDVEVDFHAFALGFRWLIEGFCAIWRAFLPRPLSTISSGWTVTLL